MCVNPLQRRVRKGLPPMERKTGTASTDEKETLRIAKVMKQKRMIAPKIYRSLSVLSY
jgi:hypothetical protein